MRHFALVALLIPSFGWAQPPAAPAVAPEPAATQEVGATAVPPAAPTPKVAPAAVSPAPAGVSPAPKVSPAPGVVPAPVPVPPVAVTDTEVSVDSWDQVDAASVAKKLDYYLSEPTFPMGRSLAEVLVPGPERLMVTQGTPPTPYLSITFTATKANADLPNLQSLARDFVKGVLGQNYFSQKFKDTLPAQEKSADDWVKEDLIKITVTTEAAVEVAPVAVVQIPTPFDIPEGLTMPPQVLLYRLGFLASPNSTISVAYTRSVCEELAVKAIFQGLFFDAIALAKHSMRGRPAADPVALYLKAWCEVRMGNSHEAFATIKLLRAAGPIPTYIMERVNGPAAAYLLQAYRTL